MYDTLISVSATAEQLDPKANGVFGLQSMAFSFMTNNMDIVSSGRTITYTIDGEVVNKYFEIWDDFNQVNVISNYNGDLVSLEDAGPTYWGVSSQEGLDFLNGTGDIPGYGILTYCNNCTERTGLPYFVISPFQVRFNNLYQLVFSKETNGGYFLYAYGTEETTQIFTSISSIDDAGKIIYLFFDLNGNPYTETSLAMFLGVTPGQIKSTMELATPIIPVPTINYTIASCCDETLIEVISGIYSVGDIVCTIDYPNHYCWTVVGTTTDPVTFTPTFCKDITFTDCTTCVSSMYDYGCPLFYDVQSCCDERSEVALVSGEVGKYFMDGNDEIWSILQQSSSTVATIGFKGEVSDCTGSACFGRYQVSKCCDGTIGYTENLLVIGLTYVDTNNDCWTVISTTTNPPTVELSLSNVYSDPNGCTYNHNHCYYLVQSCADSNIYAKTWWGDFVVDNYYRQDGYLDCWKLIGPDPGTTIYDEVNLQTSVSYTDCVYCNSNTNTYILVTNCCTSETKYVYVVNPWNRVGQTFVDSTGQCWTVENSMSYSTTGSLIQVEWFYDCSTCTSTNPCP